jgi:hypothetical protein
MATDLSRYVPGSLSRKWQRVWRCRGGDGGDQENCGNVREVVRSHGVDMLLPLLPIPRSAIEVTSPLDSDVGGYM